MKKRSAGQKRKIKAKTSADIAEGEESKEQQTEKQEEQAQPQGGDSEDSEVCVFFKKRKVASNLRRAKNPMFQTTNTEKKETAEPIFITAPVNTALVGGDSFVTATSNTETERDRDSVAVQERAKKLQKEAREKQDKVYRGQAAYLEYVGREDKSGQIKGAGIKAGPVRGNLYARAISRWDYAPDICKDYKETGYCGYGDSCKFLHDRGDYKRGWELDKEWEEQQKEAKARSEQDGGGSKKKEEEDDSFPFACFVCRGKFVDPVKTKCGHFFCERCAVKECKLNCSVCTKPTNSAFSVATKVERQKLEESMKRAEAAAAEAAQNGEEEEEEEN